MLSDAPLVTAIMPTRGRTIWAHQALQMFLDQSYPNKEIVVVDDLDERSFSVTPDFPGVRYQLLETRKTIGEKRNIANGRATGQIIMHWDSDDLYTPDRMEHQVEMLLSSGADMVGYNRMTFVDQERDKRYIYIGSTYYMIGVSLCYWRRVWEQCGFKSKNVGEDNEFFLGRNLRTATCDAGDRIIARIHAGNSFDKWALAIQRDPAQWIAC